MSGQEVLPPDNSDCISVSEAYDAMPAGSLPKLTHKQMRFVESILSGETVVNAYKKAYNRNGPTTPSTYVTASQVNHNANVQAWIEASKRAGLLRAGCTLESHLYEMERLRNKAEFLGQMGAAVTAEQSRGKVVGLYDDKGASENAITRDLKAFLLGKMDQLGNDERAKQRLREMAQRYGIEL